MTSADIYNQSLHAAAKLSKHLLDLKLTQIEIVGALLINTTSIEFDGAFIKEELLKELIHDFISIRDTQTK